MVVPLKGYEPSANSSQEQHPFSLFPFPFPFSRSYFLRILHIRFFWHVWSFQGFLHHKLLLVAYDSGYTLHGRSSTFSMIPHTTAPYEERPYIIQSNSSSFQCATISFSTHFAACIESHKPLAP
uniref:Uncharacterized protein n=1 Tax=Bionectria ochroleuca TaxID=29856 RepID=A0A8H7N7G1_BIOOC